jgi:hypothetical protein
MRKMRAALLLVVAVMLAGCAGGIDMSHLRKGMGPQEVTGLLGNPVYIYTGQVGADKAQLWTYAKDTTGVHNPLDDFGWFFPPTTHVVRLDFRGDKLTDWQSGKFKSLEALQGLRAEPKWQIPPGFVRTKGTKSPVQTWIQRSY